MSDLFRWFYCLPIGNVIVLLGIATVACVWFCKRLYMSRTVIAIMLIGWLGIILFVTIGRRIDHGTTSMLILRPFQSYHEARMTGNVEIYRSNFMNAVLFYPAGLLAVSLLPRKWPGWCRCLLAVLVLATVSAGIEFLQYRYALGRCEMDDVIHNALGAWIGCIVVLPLQRCLDFLGEKIKMNKSPVSRVP